MMRYLVLLLAFFCPIACLAIETDDEATTQINSTTLRTTSELFGNVPDVMVPFTDSFGRSSNEDVSSGAPNPPGGYTEYHANPSECTISINSSEELLFSSFSDDLCDNSSWLLFADQDMGSSEHCAYFEYLGGGNWDSSRGPRLILQSPVETSFPYGLHTQIRASDPNIAGVRGEIVNDIGSFQEQHFAETSCDDELAAFGAGDYLAACASGSGAATTLFVWNLESEDLSGLDLKNSATWGTADCDSIVTGASGPYPTGAHAGVGITTDGGGAANHTYTIDNFGATDLTPGSGTPPGPARSAGSPTTLQALGTTSVSATLTTDVSATCQYNLTGGLAYDDPGMTTFSTTGGTSHSTSVGGLVDGGCYTVSVRCSDGNPNLNDYDDISFCVDVAPDITALSAAPVDSALNMSATIEGSTFDHMNCEYEPTPVSWPGTAVSPDPTSSTFSISPLTNGTEYGVRCQACDADEGATAPACSGYEETIGEPAAISAGHEARVVELAGTTGVTVVCAERFNAPGPVSDPPTTWNPSDSSTFECNGGTPLTGNGGGPTIVAASMKPGLPGVTNVLSKTSSGTSAIQAIAGYDYTDGSVCYRHYFSFEDTAVGREFRCNQSGTSPLCDPADNASPVQCSGYGTCGGSNHCGDNSDPDYRADCCCTELDTKGFLDGEGPSTAATFFTLEPRNNGVLNPATDTVGFRAKFNDRNGGSSGISWPSNSLNRISGPDIPISDCSNGNDAWCFFEACSHHNASTVTPADSVIAQMRLCRVSDGVCDVYESQSTNTVTAIETGVRPRFWRWFSEIPAMQNSDYFHSQAVMAVKQPADTTFQIGPSCESEPSRAASEGNCL